MRRSRRSRYTAHKHDFGRLTVTPIKAADVIQSVADALQYISYYHPPDYIKNLARA